ncbi:MAG: right-handed parallel beta-helix repeat-containing protein, partial [Kiritimatiellales bacterium]
AEYQAGADPSVRDTDADGLDDGIEVSLGTKADNAADPLLVDDDAPNDLGDAGDVSISDPDEDGSLNHPFDAIQEALDAAVNGSTVLITNGLYHGAGNYNLNPQGKTVTIRSWNGASVTRINTLQQGPAFTLSSGETTNTVIMGLSMTSSSGGDPVLLLSGASARIENCILYGSSASGIECSGGSPVIRDCLIYDVAQGVYATASDRLTIQGGTISNCTDRGVWVSDDPDVQISQITVVSCDGGIRLDACGGRVDRCEIRNNSLGDETFGGGIYLNNGSSPELVNLLVVGNHLTSGSGGGVYIGSGCTPRLINCTIADNSSQYGGGIATDGDHPFFRNLIIWDNIASVSENSIYQSGSAPDIAYCCVEGGSPVMLLGPVTSDPLFVGSNNYRLFDASSPCVDSGTDGVAPLNDLDGLVRPLDGDTSGIPRTDMGCYEFSPASLDPIDSDADGVSDADELAMGTDPAQPDSDGDGFTDGEEVLVGTDPMNAGSFFSLGETDTQFAGNVVLIWDSVTTCDYTVQVTTNLQSTWMDLFGATALPGTGSQMSITNNMSGIAAYYRIKAVSH